MLEPEPPFEPSSGSEPRPWDLKREIVQLAKRVEALEGELVESWCDCEDPEHDEEDCALDPLPADLGFMTYQINGVTCSKDYFLGYQAGVKDQKEKGLE